MGEWKAEISGIWVAKYRASGYPSIKSIPGVQQLSTMVGYAYSYAYNYNRVLESHLTIANTNQSSTGNVTGTYDLFSEPFFGIGMSCGMRWGRTCSRLL